MSAFKQLLVSDVIVSPFEVNKGFSFNLSQFGEDNVQINRLLGENVDYLTNPSLTGDVNVGRESQALVYNSIKVLYDEFINSPQSYITTVGMYNDNNDLLAVAKLSKPLLKDFTKETLVRVKLDF